MPDHKNEITIEEMPLEKKSTQTQQTISLLPDIKEDFSPVLLPSFNKDNDKSDFQLEHAVFGYLYELIGGLPLYISYVGEQLSSNKLFSQEEKKIVNDMRRSNANITVQAKEKWKVLISKIILEYLVNDQERKDYNLELLQKICENISKDPVSSTNNTQALVPKFLNWISAYVNDFFLIPKFTKIANKLLTDDSQFKDLSNSEYISELNEILGEQLKYSNYYKITKELSKKIGEFLTIQ